jgi:hypothetical protein
MRRAGAAAGSVADQAPGDAPAAVFRLYRSYLMIH